MRTSPLLALAASLSTATAAIKGFNYGSTNTDNSAKVQSQYQDEFTTAQNLVGTSGFASARLYTMIQAGTANTPISAIPAAIATKTSLLLGLWASAGQASFNNELAALSAAISQYGTAFTDLVVGISVGSEDLYRISPIGIINLSGYGAQPSEIVNYIGQVRQTIAKTPLNGKPVGHVDTWTAWVNGSNSAVTSACDFVGMDAYPYFQNTQANSIENSKGLFYDAYDVTVAAAQGKPVWVTESGWPVSGPTQNQAVASVANAQTYWDEVGCSLFDANINTWWYTLQDAYPVTPSPSFGIVGTQLGTTPLYDLTCPAASSSASSSLASAGATSAAGASSSVASSSSRNTDAINSATTALSTGVVSSASAGETGVATPIPGPGLAAPADGAGASTAPAASPATTLSAAATPRASVASSASSAAGSPAGSSAGSAAGSAGSATRSAAASGANSAASSAASSAAGSAVSSPAPSAPAASDGKPETTVVVTVYTTTCPVSYSTYTSGSAVVTSPVTLSTVTYAVSTKSVAQPPVQSSVRASAPAQGSAPAGSAPAPSAPVPSAFSCPATLSGPYEYPHLIVPVDKAQPNKAYGTQYNGKFSSDVSSVFNFDIPTSYAGKTCSLVFLFPTQAQLETSSFTLKSSGGVDVSKLNTVATQSTTYSNVGAGSKVGSIPSVQPGNSYVVASGPCAAGQAVSYKVDATGGLDLEYFQDYNPSPIGMYVTVC